MNNTQHYLINMADGRVILYTKQAARQINYHSISEAVAKAISSGKISAKEVISRIKANLINNQDAWDDLLKKKTMMNTRKSTLTPEDTEGSETTPETEEVNEEFDMPLADGEGAKKNGNKANGGKGGARRSNRNEQKEETPENAKGETSADGGEAAPDDGGEAAPEDDDLDL